MEHISDYRSDTFNCHFGFAYRISRRVSLLVYNKSLGSLKYFAISPPRAAALASLITAIFYASLAGYVIPTKRAVIMLGMIAIAQFYQRHTHPLQSFAMALLVMLIFNPTMLLSIGFWLSFLAVALILYRVAGRLKSPLNWLNGVDIQLTVSLGLSPLLLFFFQQTSLISPLVNFIAVPIVELVAVPLALLTCLSMGVFRGWRISFLAF
ncbi:MAG: ComEC/Rec2 family competence protein [Methylococcaceae bacterium]|nr:ComEC/Rec2 family competence protein [Methylococcaceae bacterium]